LGQSQEAVKAKEGNAMQRNFRNFKHAFGQLDGRHVRLGLAVLALALFVLGAGAPAIDGGH
jgi:hypothetical protein